MKTNQSQFIEVAPAVPLPSSNRQTFTYSAHQDIEKLQIIRIPFGRFWVSGVVMDVQGKKPQYPVKNAVSTSFASPLTSTQEAFARWIADAMHGGIGYTLRLFFPPSGKATPAEEVGDLPSSPKVHTLAKKILPTVSATKPSVVIESEPSKRHQAIAELAAQAASEGKQVCILVPEISLIEPLTELLRSLIPPNRLAAVHSEQSTKENKRSWYGVKDGSVSVVVGTQKSLFLPWKNLGLVIIEQAYYPTHKLWDQYPRLSTSHVAPFFATIHNASLVYMSALMPLYLYYHVQEKTYVLAHEHTAKMTVTELPYLPADKNQRHLLPGELLQKLKKWNRQKKKVFILYNKKGAWQIIRCRNCSKSVTCPTCHTPLTVHATKTEDKKKYSLKCRQCGKSQPKPSVCPYCKKPSLQFIRPGLDTVASVIKSLKITPLIIEAASREQISDTRLSHAHIMIGTQAAFRMIKPGSLDRVVWLYPEDSLQYPDARSREKTRYLLTRLKELTSSTNVYVASRQNRHVTPELQLPLHKVWEQELKVRRRLSYPPYSDMVRLTVTSKNENKASLAAEKLRLTIEERIKEKKLKARVLGPFTGFVRTRRGQHESHVLLLGSLQDVVPLYRDLECDIADVMPEKIL